ncbi:hypothetical protein JCM10212_005971 [Sporobolomyces blumeae]
MSESAGGGAAVRLGSDAPLTPRRTQATMHPHGARRPQEPLAYPPLPPPSADELAFLSEVASLGEQWQLIEREEIENRISSARLDAALPHFASFAFDSAPPPAPAPDARYTTLPQPGFAPEPLSHTPSYASYRPGSRYEPHLPVVHSTETKAQHFPLPEAFPGPSDLGHRLESEHEPFRPLQVPLPPPLTTNYSAEWNAPEQGEGRPAAESRTSWSDGAIYTLPETSHRQGSFHAANASLRHPWEGGGHGLDDGNRMQLPHPPAGTPRGDLNESTWAEVPHDARYRTYGPTSWPSVLPAPEQLFRHHEAPPSDPRLLQQPAPTNWVHENPAVWSQPPLPSPREPGLPAPWHPTAPAPTSAAYSEEAALASVDNFRRPSAAIIDYAAARVQQQPQQQSIDHTVKRSRVDPGDLRRPSLADSSSEHFRSFSHSSLSTTPSSSLQPSPSMTTKSTPVAPASKAKSAASTSRRGSRQKVGVSVACVSCGDPIARLVLRGQKHELEVPYQAVFYCLKCSPGGESPQSGSGATDADGSPHDYPPSGPPASLAHRRPSQPQPAVPNGFRKKNKRLDAGATLTACDVCLMDRATGSVVPLYPESGQQVNFQVEVVCVSCDAKYKLCSDCGGGGGVRLGTGKWRSKELFKDGKRTCSLRHQRLGAFPEMEYQVWKNTDIPRDEVDEISKKCGDMFANQMLGAIAIPEVLERNGAIWTTYEEAESHARSGWCGMDPMIRYDIEPTHQIRRYLALRLCAPNLRKTSRKIVETPPSPAAHGKILRSDKEIVGYIIAEWDQPKGALFLALVIPWDATGESYDATTLLLQALCSRVQQDQQEMNAQRLAVGQPPIPKLERVFTMIFFKTGSRMITQLTKKRGFAPLEDFLRSHPNVDPSQFPPVRPIYLPVPRQAGWLVLVRNLRETADGRLDDWSARRSADEERGKRKEVRAKAAREKKAQQGVRE